MKAKALLHMRGRFFFGLIHCDQNPSSDQTVNEQSIPINLLEAPEKAVLRLRE